MKLPPESSKRISEALSSHALLDKPVIAGVVESMAEEKHVNWNLVLTKQLESEQGGSNETES